MADVVENIKARLDVVEVVSSYVQLKKTGRNFKGLCPFHSEKTPSFVVSSEKQIWHCFGCNKGGDIFTFIEEMEGVEFSEALQILGDRAGVKIENISKFSKKEGKTEKNIYFKAHDLACDFFQKQLHKTPAGKKVLEYLSKRGLKDETIREFKIGFAPDQYDALYPMLLKKGISKKILVKSGFVSSKAIASDQVFDKFRGRLMFPIFDYLGRVCGFGGRALKKDQMPKYLNSPENRIYNKSRILYGLYRAKQYVKQEDRIVLVEGYFDVILPFQEGVKNVSAVSGIALTNDQATLIKRLTPNVVTCFDLDEAGFEATKRSFKILQKQDLMVKTVGDFEGKDPADIVSGKGGKAFKKIVHDAKDFVLFYIEKLIEKNDVETLEGRRNVIKEMLPLCKQMSSSTKDFYVRELATKLSMKEKFLYDEIENFKLPIDHPARRSVEEENKGGKSGNFSLEEILCGIVLDNPHLFEKLSKLVNEKDFFQEMKDVYKGMYDQYNKSRNGFSKWDFSKSLLSNLKEKIDILLLYADEKYGRVSEESLQKEIEKLVDKIKKMRKSRQLDDLQKRIIEAEKSENREKLMKLLKEQQKLLSEP
jgi:DNA primase